LSLGLFACGACGAGWMVALAWRAPEGSIRVAARGLFGGLSAFLVAWGGYALLEHGGMRVSWAEVSAGGGGGVALAAAIGLVEESAKLFGMSLASVGTRRGGNGLVIRIVLGVSASFATLECATALRDADPMLLVLRSSLAPVAHAVLAAPLGLVLEGGVRGIRWALPALLLAAALHGAADLSLATPAFGRLGYAAVLAAPAVFLHLHARFAGVRAARALGGTA